MTTVLLASWPPNPYSVNNTKPPAGDPPEDATITSPSHHSGNAVSLVRSLTPSEGCQSPSSGQLPTIRLNGSVRCGHRNDRPLRSQLRSFWQNKKPRGNESPCVVSS